jgi:hypothetical protein
MYKNSKPFRHPNEAVLELIAALYKAAVEPGEWSKVLKSIAHLFHGHAAFTMTVGAGAHDEPGLHFYNLPIESFVAYGEHYYQHDLWSPSWISQGPHYFGSVYSGDQLVEEESFKSSVWFNEFLRPLDIEHSLFASLSEDTHSPAILVIDRPLILLHSLMLTVSFYVRSYRIFPGHWRSPGNFKH